jgi:signal transduction histidine kinase
MVEDPVNISKLESLKQFSKFDLDTLKEIKIGSHVCSIHEDREQSISLAAAFLKLGLENQEKCLYIGSQEKMSEKLEKIGVEKKYLETGQMSLVPGDIRSDERFKIVKQTMEFAIREGYRCLRVALEMMSTEEILEYEAKLNEFYLNNPALGLCQYVWKPFEGELLLRAVKSHPMIYTADVVCENPFYLSSLVKDAEKELQSYLRILIDMTALKDQYTECEIRSREIVKERTKKLQDSRDAIFNMLKDMDESYKKLQKAYEELQTLDEMKDEFISNVSHELKTPLISIKGYGELLRDEKIGNLSEKQKAGLETIVRNADRLTRLINSMMFMTSLHAGKIEFHFEPVDLNEIFSICESDFKSMLEHKQIIFEKSIGEVSSVWGEKDRIIEVISNLLDNAIKFTPSGGRVSIKASDEEKNVHIRVSDNGIGITPDIIPKLFQRFYQADASSTRKYGGIGIGLYITKNIIDAFNGKIWIESEVGKGTNVHVLLPVSRKEVGQ